MTNYCMLRSTLMLRWAENRTQDTGRSMGGIRVASPHSACVEAEFDGHRARLCYTPLFYSVLVFTAGLNDRLKGGVMSVVVRPYGCVSSSAIWTGESHG